MPPLGELIELTERWNANSLVKFIPFAYFPFDVDSKEIRN